MTHSWLAIPLLACACAAAGAYPVPNRTTPVLRRILRTTRELAVNASAAALPDLLAFLDSSNFRQELRRFSSVLWAWPSQELLRAFRAEVSVMELVHNWRPEPSGPLYDLTLDAAQALEFFPNIWELHALGFKVPDEPLDSLFGHVLDQAEQHIYGLPPFSSAKWPGFPEAVERPVYIALNMYKVDMGNPYFGGISTVFSGSFVREMVMVSAFDTGMLEAHCDPAVRSNCTEMLGAETCKQLRRRVSCRAWPGVLGTLQHFDHLLLAKLRGYLQAPTTMVAKLFARALEGSVKVNMEEVSLYWEANIFGGAHFPAAVKFHIASFAELFGTPDGERLRAWCVKYGWPLVWSTSRKLDKDVPHSFDERVLDPEVVLHTPYSQNLTANAQFNESLHSFRRAWEGGVEWEPFLQAQPQLLRLRPLRAGACRHPDTCVGINLQGTCICKETSNVIWV